MTTTENPLPAFLAVPDGDEPLSEPDVTAWVDGDSSADGYARVVGWEVDGPATAEWALRKLAAVEAEVQEVDDQAAAWISEIERWRDERIRPLTAKSAFFTDRLTGWLRRLRDADPKVKSKALPSGTISSRSVPAKVEVVDVDAVAAWARSAGRDDVLKVSVRLTELRKAVTVDEEAGVARDADTGEPVPGAVVHPGGVSFSVKVGG